MTCCVLNCNRPATGTAHDVGGPADVCQPCGIHFWGNFSPYPADEPIDYPTQISEASPA